MVVIRIVAKSAVNHVNGDAYNVEKDSISVYTRCTRECKYIIVIGLRSIIIVYIG